LAALLGSLPGFIVRSQGHGGLLIDLLSGEPEIDVGLIVWDTGRGPEASFGEERLDGGIPVLALVTDEAAAAAAWRLGARGILRRDASEEELAAAAAAVVAGFVVLAPAFVLAFSRAQTPDSDLTIELTPREFEVLNLLAEGLTNKAIAHRLTISEHTVKFHVNAILNKLDAQSRTDAVVRATRLGLIAL
jgi:DNA-binding NarL/FixJ family response regulator